MAAKGQDGRRVLRISRGSLVVFIATMALSSALFGAETLEGVESEIQALWEKVDSYSARLKTASSSEKGGLDMSVKGTGTVECLKKGGKVLFRTEMIQSMSAGEQKIEQKIMSVFDGEHIFSYTEALGQKVAVKMKYDEESGIIAGSGEKLFDQLREVFKMELLPDEKINGEQCYVVELRNKALGLDGKADEGLSKLYISRKTGLQIQMDKLDSAGKAVSKRSYENIKLNPGIDESRFRFEPPEGVQLLDMTTFKLDLKNRE